MENKEKHSPKVKTTVFNLIILDESGSMMSAINSTISGCNETIQCAKALQQKHSDVQNSFISIYAFQDGVRPSRYICKNKPSCDVHEITDMDYQPGGCTPMLDAIGATLVDLKAIASTHEDALGVVTIITDGLENSSTEYTYPQVARIIDSLKEMGWTFNFIGANIDVKAGAARLHIDNHLEFQSNEVGTKKMFATYNRRMSDWNENRIREEQAMAPNVSHEERVKYRESISKKFFKH